MPPQPPSRLDATDPPDLAEQIRAFTDRIAGSFDRRPVTKAEWDWACGDEDPDQPPFVPVTSR